MPYFWWEGITMTGIPLSGYSFAPTDSHLEKQLFKQHIALTRTKNFSFLMYFYTINLIDKVDFYDQLATLLDNGIQLAPAFILIAQQIANPTIQEILFSCGMQIEAGININDILIKHSRFFDILACQTIAIGLETGTLVIVCKMLSSYYKRQAIFKNKIRTVLLAPKLTALAIIVVGLLLFIFFIPKLSNLFATLNVPRSSSTNTLIAMSNFIQSTQFLYIIAIMIAIISLFIIIKNKSSYIQNNITSFYYRIPFIRFIMIAYAQVTFFSFLDILLNSGIKLPQALTIIVNALPKGNLRNTAQALHEQVHAGQTIAIAMTNNSFFFNPYQIAIISIAQETAHLPQAIHSIAQKSLDKIDKLTKRIILWIGPLLLLFLGLAVAMLMVAMYSPLIQLSAGLR